MSRSTAGGADIHWRPRTQHSVCGSREESSLCGQDSDVPTLCLQPAFLHHFFARTQAVCIPPCRDLLQTVLNFSTNYFWLKF